MFWTYAAFNMGYHAVFSITIPILLTELVFPRWRHRQWLGFPGTVVVGVVYVLNAAGIGLLWYAVLQESVYHVPARLHLPQQIAAALLVVVLILCARWAAGGRTSTPGGPKPPSAAMLALLAGVGALGWFALLYLSSLGDRLGWLPFPIPIVLAAAAVSVVVWSLRRWSARTDLQVLAVCFAALIVQMGAGFAVLGTGNTTDILGKAVLNLAAIAALTILARHLRKRSPTTSGQARAVSNEGPPMP